MDTQEAYKQKLAAQLKEWSAQINLFAAKIENAKADVTVNQVEELHELRAKQQVASEKLKEFGKSSGEAWEQLKITADILWKDLKTGITVANSKFK